MLKITYDTIFLFSGGIKGNVSQGYGIAYAECSIADAQAWLDAYLLPKKRCAVIEKVETIKGHCLPAPLDLDAIKRAAAAEALRGMEKEFRDEAESSRKTDNHDDADYWVLAADCLRIKAERIEAESAELRGRA